MTRATRAYHTGLLFFGYLAFYWLIQYLINSTEVDYFLSLDALFPFIPEFVWVYHTLPVGIFLVINELNDMHFNKDNPKFIDWNQDIPNIENELIITP